MANRKSDESVVSLLIMTWPNLISLLRLFSVPLIISFIISHEMKWAFWLALAAGATDMIDGLLARVLKTPSKVGAYLDPIADKALLVGLFATLGFKDYIPSWLVVIVIFRDIMILAGTTFLLLMKKKFEMNPIFVSKLHTLFQIVVVAWILHGEAYGVLMPWVKETLLLFILLTTILSGISYVILWLRYVSR